MGDKLVCYYMLEVPLGLYRKSVINALDTSLRCMKQLFYLLFNKSTHKLGRKTTNYRLLYIADAESTTYCVC